MGYRVVAPPAVAHPPDGPTPLPPGGPNAIGHMLGLIGDEWNLLIMRAAMFGTTRYGEWRRELPISDAVLSRRLLLLTEMAIFERVGYQTRRFEYRLTRRGRGVWPILLTIWAWEAAWVPEHVDELLRVSHRVCGRDLLLVPTCAACGETVGPGDVAGVLGPSGAWARGIPVATTRRRAAPPDERPPGMYPQTTALIGNRWSAAMLGAAFQGLRRFHEFERRLGAPPTVVADRLRAFCELGVFRQEPGDGRADRPSYRLTDKGRAFYPVIMTSIDWAQRWFQAPEGPAVVLTHRACGHPFRPRLACGACAAQVRGCEVDVAGCT